MAKITIAGLKSAGAAYVTAAKQAGAWNKTSNNMAGLLDQIAKTVMVDGSFQDKLGILDGEDLPLGKTIQEYFVDLTLPEAFDSTGSTTYAPHVPSFESVVYNYTLGRKVIPTTVRYDDLERACKSADEFGSMIAKIMERLTNSETMWRYAQKKQLIANLISKADSAGCSKVVDKPVDDLTSEAFITELKCAAEDASFANEGNNLGNYLIGAAPELVVFVRKSIVPTMQVQALSGAVQKEELAVPARIIVVDDFGDAADKYFAVICDPRGIKLHSGYRAVREQLNAQGDFMNYYLHTENTGYISKSTFVRVYKTEA